MRGSHKNSALARRRIVAKTAPRRVVKPSPRPAGRDRERSGGCSCRMGIFGLGWLVQTIPLTPTLSPLTGARELVAEAWTC